MNRNIGNIFKGDKVIWMVFLFLCAISVIEVFSASSTLTYKSQNYLGPISYHTFTIVVGALVAIVTLNVPCRYFKLLTPILLLASYGTLIWVLFGGESINGANRVIRILGLTFQPSEIAKGTMVLVTAQILSAMQREDGKGADPKAMRYILYLVLPTVALIGVENLSTACLLFSVVFLMMFFGRVPLAQMGKLTGAGVALVAAFLALVLLVGGYGASSESAETPGEVAEAAQAKKAESKGVFHRFVTWRNRIVKPHAQKDVPPEEYDIDNNYQVAHGNMAIASSGIIGKGPGNSTERDYLPQAFSDFIFAIIIEEMGIIGAGFVVFLYVILMFRCARIAGRCENNFPAFLVLGLALLLVIQAVINMMVAVDFGIVTGQPLPLISKGGTSTIINCAYIGVILSVSRSAKRQSEPSLKKVRA